MTALVLALITILLWSTLAALVSRLGHLPPLLTTGLALALGGLTGIVRVRAWRVPLTTLLVGIGGLFGYHALLFTAMRIAPPVEVNLLNYLWPLLIVVLSPLYVRGQGLRWNHLAGALLGLVGAALVITGGRLSLDGAHVLGYSLALLAALTWSNYSLLSARLPAFPTGAVGGFCLASGLLSLAMYGVEAGGVMPPLTGRDALFLLVLGMGPMGLAFYTWDAAMKKGDPRIIGALAYLTPLLSTWNLATFGGKPLSGLAWAAMALIVVGALLGALDLLRASQGSAQPGR